MRQQRNNKSRVKIVAYSTTVNWTPGFHGAILRVGLLTGALALNIIDPYAEEGDELTVLVKADGSARVVTIGGAAAAGGTVSLGANGEAAIKLIASGVGTVVRYMAAVVPA